MAQPSNPPDDTREDDARAEEMRAWMVRYGPALRRYFEKRVGRAEAEDLVQDVFVAMQVRGALDEPEKVDRYLFRVAAHILARRRQRGGWNWSAHAELDDEGSPPDELSPERILIANERLARLMSALNALPPRMAEAFVLHRFDEMTYAEIARRMGVSVRTVESFIARAVTRVAVMVEGGQ
jgi:RNA polymerase sigma-70 factor (ECF subfamily)